MNFHPDFLVSGVVIAVSPKTAGIKLRITEDGCPYEPWYKLSYYAERRLPQKGRKVELSVGSMSAYFINSWCYVDTPAAPYKLEPPAGEDIPFEVST